MENERRSLWSSFGMLVSALLAAPCFVGLLLVPLGFGAIMASSLFVFLDEYRLFFMLLALALLGVTHWGLRRAREFRPTALVWGATILVLLLIAGELIVDTPMGREGRLF